MGQPRPMLVLLLILPLVTGACGSRDEAASSAAASTVKFTSEPPAEVWIGGDNRGVTPLALSLPPGDGEATFRRAGFAPETVKFRAAPGAPASVGVALVVADPDDDGALAAVVQALGEERTAPDAEPAIHRGGGRGGITLYWPQREVRKSGLRTFRVDVDETYEGGGALEFRKAGKVLYTREFDPELLTTVENLPPAVLHGIEAGDVVTWGVVVKDAPGRSATISFKVVGEAKVEKRLKKLAESQFFQKQPKVVQEILKADALRDAGLHSEALERYLSIGAEFPEATQSFRGAVTSGRALDLDDTGMYAEAAQKAGGVKGREAAPPPKGRTAPPEGTGTPGSK